jgi:hypothetical protein
MLHQLKNGNWIDLMNVRKIVAKDGYETVGREIGSRVMRLPQVHVFLDAIPGDVEWVGFDSFAAARAYRDELAGLVNDALAGLGKPVDEADEIGWVNFRQFT